MTFSVNKTIYYDDTDAGGVLYHANYLRYMDHARSEYLTQHGFAFHELPEKHQKGFVVVNANINYRKPCVLGDKITVTAEIGQIGATSIEFKQTIMRQSELMSDAIIKIVIIDMTTMRPTKIPHFLLEAIKHA